MSQPVKITVGILALFAFATGGSFADDPMPPGLTSAIENPAIPSILDVTILDYNDEGHGVVAINKIYKAGTSTSGNAWSPPKTIRGYGYVGSDKIAQFKTVADAKKTRFLVFLDGDLLYSTYNNRFPIRENKEGIVEVGTGFNGSGGPWLAISEVVKRIPTPVSFERKYIQAAKLTKAQEQNIIELANQCGITNVAKISTYYLRPTRNRGITVESVEEIAGRDVSCDVLEIRYEKWWPQIGGPPKGDNQIGDFSAGNARPRKQTILKVGNKEYRTRSIAGLTIEECEAILAEFLKGNYKLARGKRNRLEQVDWTQPSGFYKRGDVISVSFPHKQAGEGFFDLEFEDIDPKITITQVMQAVP